MIAMKNMLPMQQQLVIGNPVTGNISGVGVTIHIPLFLIDYICLVINIDDAEIVA